jgi:multidrug resistance efflux pump
MKNIYFKRTDSVFRSIQEEKIVKPKRRINWDRLVYIVLLCTFLFFTGRYAFYKIYYIKADGQVMFQNVDIQNIEDCRIYNFRVKEGQQVKKGDTLFYFADKKYEKSASSLNVNTNWEEKELILIEEEISVLGKEETLLRKKLRKTKKELNKVRQEVLLDILPKASYNQKEDELNLIADDLELTSHKIKSLGEKRQKVMESLRLKKIQDAALKQHELAFGPMPYLSPIEGMVSKIFKEDSEIAVASEVIMYVQQKDNIFIKAFFEQADLKYLQNRNTVELEFPDGTISRGRINRFYYSTYTLPEEFQKKYEPTTRSLAVDIVPYSEEEFKKWKKYYKLSVIVRKSRFQ